MCTVWSHKPHPLQREEGSGHTAIAELSPVKGVACETSAQCGLMAPLMCT